MARHVCLQTQRVPHCSEAFYAKRRKAMINKLGIPAIQTGVGRAQIQTPERKGGVKPMKKHRGAALHWFQNGHPMKTAKHNTKQC